ncbi:hypothetical protein [Shewanella sp.]
MKALTCYRPYLWASSNRWLNIWLNISTNTNINSNTHSHTYLQS